MTDKKVTPADFLRIELEAGINPNNKAFVRLAEATAKQLNKFKGMTAIDFGAGVGVYAKAMADAGFSIAAQDIWKEHRDFIKKTYPDLKVIAKPIKADIMLFIEVAEHMSDEEIEAVVAEIDPQYILFSSTSEKTPNDEAWGHINIKSKEEWLEFWAFAGYGKDSDLTKPTTWSMLLKKI